MAAVQRTHIGAKNESYSFFEMGRGGQVNVQLVKLNNNNDKIKKMHS